MNTKIEDRLGIWVRPEELRCGIYDVKNPQGKGTILDIVFGKRRENDSYNPIVGVDTSKSQLILVNVERHDHPTIERVAYETLMNLSPEALFDQTHYHH